MSTRRYIAIGLSLLLAGTVAAQERPPRRDQGTRERTVGVDTHGVTGSAPSRGNSVQVPAEAEGEGTSRRRWQRTADEDFVLSKHCRELEEIAKEIESGETTDNQRIAMRIRRVCEDIRRTSPYGFGYRSDDGPMAFIHYRDEVFQTDDEIRRTAKEIERIEQRVTNGEIPAEEAASTRETLTAKHTELLEARTELLGKLRSRTDRIVSRLDSVLEKMNKADDNGPQDSQVKQHLKQWRDLLAEMPEQDDELMLRLREMPFAPEHIENMYSQFGPGQPQTDWKARRLESEMNILRERMQALERELQTLRPPAFDVDWPVPGTPPPPQGQPPRAPRRP